METLELLDAIRKGFLFDIERRHRRGLSQGLITDELREAFLQKGVLVPEAALVETVQKGKEWRITDGSKGYILAQVRDFIRVYWDIPETARKALAEKLGTTPGAITLQDIPEMTRKTLAEKLGTTPGAITRLAKGSLKLSKEMADALVENLFVSEWLAEQIMFCAARDALSSINTRRDKAVAVLIRREFAGYPNVLKWIVEQTKEEA